MLELVDARITYLPSVVNRQKSFDNFGLGTRCDAYRGTGGEIRFSSYIKVKNESNVI